MTADKRDKQKNLIHVSFEIGLTVKAVDGVLEIIGALLLLFLNPSRINFIARFLTQRELSEDPRNVVANLLIRFAQSFSVNTRYFGVVYLAAHGIKNYSSYFSFGAKSFGHTLSPWGRLYFSSPIRFTGTP